MADPSISDKVPVTTALLRLSQWFPEREQIKAEIARRQAQSEEKSAPTSIGDIDELPALSRIAARLEPNLRRRFLLAVEHARDRLELEALAEAIRSGSLQRVEDMVNSPAFVREIDNTFSGVLQTGFLRGAEFANTQLTGVGLGLNFDLMNPHSVTFISRYVPQLAEDLGNTMGRNVQNILGQAFEQGIPPLETARKIRDHIGLTERDSARVAELARRMREDGASEAKIAVQQGKLLGALERRRSITIARTELIRAHNEGQQSLWDEAKTQGLLDPSVTRREWIATPDDRTDIHICLPLDGEQTELHQPFVVGGHEFMGPPAHPNCRCAVGLKFLED